MLPAPPIVLADEPTGSLDTANGAHIVRILEDLAHVDGVCVIVVTHDAQVAARADEVLHLNDGQVARVEPRRRAE
jgi:ABC-type lipoprotein export system ATPase subunit